MYFRHTNKTAVRSQQIIAQALLRLMEHKPFAQITVTEICCEAGVGRKTFYRNYEFREDAIDFQLDLLLAQYRDELQSTPVSRHLRHHLEFIDQHAALLILLHKNGFHETINTKFSALLPDTMPLWTQDPIEQQYRSRYIIGGIEAIVRMWIERGCQESIDDVEHLISLAQQGQIPLIGKNEKSDIRS